MESMHDLEVLIDSGRQLIVLETEREGCFIDGFKRLSNRSSRAFHQWTVTQGLLRLSEGYEAQRTHRDLNQLFGQILATKAPSVFILIDFHHYLSDPVAIRHIKDVMHTCPQHSLILLSETLELPDELRQFATDFRLPLPNYQQLESMVNELTVQWVNENKKKLSTAREGIVHRLIDRLCGLSLGDARRMAEHAIWNDGVIDDNDLDDIARRKFDLLNRNNVLSLELDYEELTHIAGFDNLKRWLEVRRRVFLDEVTLPGGDRPKGMLLLGIQGCGKSMAAKAVAGSWGLPLLHLDFGTLYNRFYGQTEENLRSALNTSEKMAPCVLWLDEIEKGLSAVSSSDDVSKRLLGTFLTWLAENKQSVFVVATANDVSALPPELIRKGRFDEVFFVDLPTPSERLAILNVHLKRRNVSDESIDLETVVKHTEGFSGAELEQLIVSAIYHTYEATSQVDTRLLLRMVVETKPLSVIMAEQIAGLRDWAQGRAVNVSSL